MINYKDGSSTSQRRETDLLTAKSTCFPLNWIKDYESSVYEDCISAIFDHWVNTESKNETTCTYQNERHFCGHFKTQGADLSSRISPCLQPKLHPTLAQCKMSSLLTDLGTRLSKTSWSDRVTRLFEILSARWKAFQNSNESTTIMSGS